MTTIEKSEIDRAIAQAVAELIAHGGSKADVAQMVQHFKTLSEEAKQAANKIEGIPD